MFVGGRIFASLIGLLVLGIPGAAMGFVMGMFFDRAVAGILAENLSVNGAGKAEEIKTVFMRLLFTALGQVAKADGNVSADEIAHTESLINGFSLDADGRKQAITWFQEGVKQEAHYRDLVKPFKVLARFRPELKQVLLESVVSLAMADGELDSSEEAMLLDIAQCLGIPARAFQQLLDQLKGQQGFHQSRPNTASQLEAAYRVLGVTKTDTDKDIKKSYRKLMSKHHPDKMIAQGVPESAIKMATEKTQDIQDAYSVIKKSRAD